MPAMAQRTFSRAAAVIGIVLVTVACGTPALDTTPPATETQPPAVASPSTSDAASSSVEPSPGVTSGYPYAVGTTIQVVADTLRAREAPGTDADIVARLARDTRAVVTDGPTEADGFTWFQVESSAGAGWVADGDAETRWIVAAPPVEPAELALRFRTVCDVAGPFTPPSLTVTADRDVVMTGGPAGEGGWQTGRLTPAAFDELMALLDLPALAESAQYVPVRREDAGEPPGHGLCIYGFTFGPATDRVRVTSVSWFGDEEEATYYVPSPERKVLSGLAERLSDPNLFTDAAWEAPPADYEANAFLVWIQPDAAPPAPGRPIATDVLGDLDSFGEPVPSGRCGYLDRAGAEELAAAFAGSATPLDLHADSYLTVASDAGGALIITLPILPDAYPSCGDLGG